MPASEGTVRSVGRALGILDIFVAQQQARLPLTSLVRLSGLPRTTVLRLIETLVVAELLEYAEEGVVSIGSRMARWAIFAEVAWRVPAETTARMSQLALQTGETVSVYTRSGAQRLAAAQAPAPASLRHVVQVGDRLPLWKGASAMVLLAADTRANALEQNYRAFGDEPGVPELTQLADRVNAVRKAGWAVSHGEREAGISGVAVPLVVGVKPVALAIGGPTARFTSERVPGFVAALRDAARDIRVTGLPLVVSDNIEKETINV